MTETADAVVVGAGVIGSSIALELGRAGRDVVVVDKAAGPGQGSTSASSAIVRFNYSTWTASRRPGRPGTAGRTGRSTSDSAGPRRAGPASAGPACVMLDADPVAPNSACSAMFDGLGVPARTGSADDSRPGCRASTPAGTGRRNGSTTTLSGPSRAGRLRRCSCPTRVRRRPALAARTWPTRPSGAGVTYRFRQHRRRGPTRPMAGHRRGPGRRRRRCPRRSSSTPPGRGRRRLNAIAGVGGDFTVSVRPLRQEVHHVPAPPGYNHGDAARRTIADLDLGTYMRGTPGDGLLVGGTEPECDPLEWLDDARGRRPSSRPSLYQFEAQVPRARGAARSSRCRARRAASPASTTSPATGRRSTTGPRCRATTWPWAPAATSSRTPRWSGSSWPPSIDAVENGHDHDSEPVRSPGSTPATRST